MSPYGLTKLAAEHLCRLYHRGFEIPTVALRYFTIFGPAAATRTWRSLASSTRRSREAPSRCSATASRNGTSPTSRTRWRQPSPRGGGPSGRRLQRRRRQSRDRRRRTGNPRRVARRDTGDHPRGACDRGCSQDRCGHHESARGPRLLAPDLPSRGPRPASRRAEGGPRRDERGQWRVVGARMTWRSTPRRPRPCSAAWGSGPGARAAPSAGAPSCRWRASRRGSPNVACGSR